MNNLQEIYNLVRQKTEEVCKPLVTEDYVIQSLEEVSPPKWHIAHISWFFENFILSEYLPNYKVFNSDYNFLFNSYYNSVGKMIDRPIRKLLARPVISEVYEYRKHVDYYMNELLKNEISEEIKILLEIGLNHEQQHQELLFMDIKSNFYFNPLKPQYTKTQKYTSNFSELKFIEIDDDIAVIGHENNNFFFDNEKPVHKAYINKFQMANRPVLNGEYLEFIENGGYDNAKYWLADGWTAKNINLWTAPMYWEKIDNEWFVFSLNGLEKIDKNSPVSHISYYEAEAYAHYAGKRLPTEFEWEYIAKKQKIEGNFMDNGFYKAISGNQDSEIKQMFGDVWEWTSSGYLPYPGFDTIYEGLGEYNGKFMVNQMVLRGGCSVTPLNHIRSTYRNFFYPQNRWQFSGIRLAK